MSCSGTTVEENDVCVSFLTGISQLIVQGKVVFNDSPSGKTFDINLFQRTMS